MFERIATGVLRIADPALHGVVETGTNARGQTIADPADGILYATTHDGADLAIVVHHTITRKAGLRSKWLDPTDGDVSKAIQLFDSASEKVGNRKRVLVLTSAVDPNSALVTDIEALAVDKGLTIDVWPGSRLAHVLDVDPDGQWLRHQSLGLPQQRLSFELLRKIAAQTLEDARPLGDPAEYVPRKLSQQLDDRFAGSNGLVFVQGRSGSGKSVLCYDWAKRGDAGNGICLVLNEETLAEANTLEEALARTLRSYAPTLSETSYQAAISEVSGPPSVSFWIEDINRSRAPIDLVRKLFRWTATSASNSKGGRDQSVSRSLKLLCPVWPEHIQAMTRDERDRVDRSSIFVADYTSDEAVQAVLNRAKSQSMSLTKLQAVEAAKALNHDPLLIGLTTDWDKLDPGKTIAVYIDNALSRMAADGQYRKSEYRNCLSQLGAYMLSERVLAPTFEHALTAMERRGCDSLFRRLLHDGAITNVDANERLRFRHDRVRDRILVDHVVTLLDATEEHADILEDPFLAEVVGAAVFSVGDNSDFVKLSDAISPLSLFHLFARAVQTKSESREQLFMFCQNKLASPDVRSAPKRQVYAIQSLLSRLDGDDVRRLLEATEEDSFFREEGLARNRCVKSAAAFCYHHDPYVNSPRRDALLSHLKSIGGDEWIREVQSFLTNFEGSEKLEQGALHLAGEIGATELIDPLKSIWRNHVEEGRGLTSGMLYAAIRCAAGRDDVFVEEVLSAWSTLPDEDEEREHSNPRYDVAHYVLSGAVRRDPSDRIINCLLSALDRFSNLRHSMYSIMKVADHPDAVVFIAKAVAEVDRRCEDTESFNLWATSFTDQWGGRRDRSARSMSKISRAALKAEWQNPENDIWMRRRSFDLWSARLNRSDLHEMAVSTPKGLEDRALRARLVNRDSSAKPLLAEKIREGENDRYWLQFIRYVDSTGLEELIAELFEKRKSFFQSEPDGYFPADDILPELLADRDDDFAVQTLVRHWDQLQSKRTYVIALLYLATPETLTLAKTVIDDSTEPEKVLEFFDMRVGIKTFNRPGIKRIQQIEAVMPYFNHLSDHSKWSLWEVCNERGWYAWRRANLDPLLVFPGDRNFARINEAEDFQWLDQRLSEDRRFRSEAHYWAKYRLEAGFSANELVARAWRYSSDRQTDDAYSFLCDVIAEHGKRSDCALLEMEWALADKNLQTEKDSAEFAVRQRTFE